MDQNGHYDKQEGATFEKINADQFLLENQPNTSCFL